MKAQATAIAILAVGLVAAAMVATMPQISLDLMVARIGLPQLIGAASPPIGVTGRTLLAVLALLPFVGVAAMASAGPGGFRWPARAYLAVGVADDVPTVRRADAHPDAPPRRPIRAGDDLGAPLPIRTISVTRGVPELEQPLPYDLDQPLAPFDPVAIPDVPREPVRAVAPLVPTPPVVIDAVVVEAVRSDVDFAWGGVPAAKVVEAHEVDVTEAERAGPVEDQSVVVPAALPDERAVETAGDPVLEPTPEPAPPGEPSIASLLDRLERGARKKGAVAEQPEKAESLDDTLVMLRRLAAP